MDALHSRCRLVSRCLPVILMALGTLSASAQNSASDLLSQAMGLAARGELGQAEILLEQARTAAPHNTEVLTALAKVKDRVGESQDAIAIFRQVADATPRSGEAHLNLAMALADSKDLTGALDEVSKAVELAPKLASVHLNRARILADMHRTDEARTEFALASRLAPTNADCYFYWALVEQEKENYAKESSLLQSVVASSAQQYEGAESTGREPLERVERRWRPLRSGGTCSRSIPTQAKRPIASRWRCETRTIKSPDGSWQRFHALQQQEKTVKQVNDLGNQAYHAMNNRQWPEAISLMRQALALCGDCQYQATLHKDLGLALCQSGDMQQGETELRIGPSIEPRGPGYPEGAGGDPSPVVTRPIYFLDPHARLVDAYVVRILVRLRVAFDGDRRQRVIRSLHGQPGEAHPELILRDSDSLARLQQLCRQDLAAQA